MVVSESIVAVEVSVDVFQVVFVEVSKTIVQVVAMRVSMGMAVVVMVNGLLSVLILDHVTGAVRVRIGIRFSSDVVTVVIVGCRGDAENCKNDQYLHF